MRSVLLLLAVTLFLTTSTVQASPNTLDIQAELSRPGVKLVVVEFYATWCIPCMEAVPKWKALHRRYSSQGLRFIVISADDNDGCVEPPDWSPDVMQCDSDGKLKKRFGVKSLPTSFLYSWDGNLALRSREVEPIEQAIERYFKESHIRMTVGQPEVIGDRYAISGNESWVRDYVIGKLLAQSKFDVVTQGVPSGGSGSKSCPAETVGVANSHLHIRLQGDERGNRTLTLRLDKDGCILASSSRPYKGDGMQEDVASLRQAAAEAVAEIIAKVVGRTIAASMRQTNSEQSDIDIDLPPPDPNLGFGHLHVNSWPTGAAITLNGEKTGKRTPFLFEDLPVGQYRIELESLEAVGGKVVRVKPNEVTRVEIELGKSKQGSLLINTEPPGLMIQLDGKPAGKSPLFIPSIDAGKHHVKVVDHQANHLFKVDRYITVKAGERNRVTLTLVDALQTRRERVSFQARLSGGLEILDTDGVAGLIQIGIGTGKWVDIHTGVGLPGYVWVTDIEANLYPYGRFVPTLTLRTGLGFDPDHQYYSLEGLAGLEMWALDWLAFYVQIGVGGAWNTSAEPTVSKLIVPAWLGMEMRY